MAAGIQNLIDREDDAINEAMERRMNLNRDWKFEEDELQAIRRMALGKEKAEAINRERRQVKIRMQELFDIHNKVASLKRLADTLDVEIRDMLHQCDQLH